MDSKNNDDLWLGPNWQLVSLSALCKCSPHTRRFVLLSSAAAIGTVPRNRSVIQYN
jgi:hypothetical protein